MFRLGVAAAVSILFALVWQAALAETKLGSTDSVVAPLRFSNEAVRIDGVGCGSPASTTLPLPAGVSDVRVRQPTVGARNSDARLTDVAIQDDGVTFTAVADGADICGASEPAGRSWSLSLGRRGDDKLDISFSQRVTVAVYDDYPQKRTIRPRSVRIGIAFSARRLRWKHYGGRKAVGYGVFKSLTPCAGGCTDNGTRLEVVLTRPAYCPDVRLSDLNPVFYGKVAFVLRERLGRLKPGTEWVSDKPLCALGAKPIRIAA